jgi:integrase
VKAEEGFDVEAKILLCSPLFEVSAMRHSSFPPKLRKFVKSVEKKAQAAGKSAVVARIFGAWSACFVRFCTVNDRSWRESEHVPAFLDYLERRKDVDDTSRIRAAEAMVFLFQELLKTDLGDVAWHPDRQPEPESETEEDEASASEKGNADGEQSTLLTRLLFHTSLPINEALELCAGDVDLDAGLIYVSDPMGTPKQIIELPDTLHDPMGRHLQRLREEHGPRYFDAPLFQARALQGRRGDDEASEEREEPEHSSPPTADAPDEEDPSDRPASLWGYAEES